MSSPKISVLVPTYNYARYLPETIESILEQDWQDLEILVSDDASTDNSAEIIAHYAAKDSRIRFQIHTANLGMVQNWNWCLSQARGEYVKYLFGDDKFTSRHALRRLIRLLEDNPSAALAASARYVIGEDSEVLDIWNDFNQPGLHQGSDVIAQCLDANRNLIGEPSVVLFRRRDAARGFNLRYRQIVDQEMWFHLLEKGDFAYVSEPLCCFRRHDRQQTEINKGNQVGELEALQLLADCHAKPHLRFKGFRKRLFSRVYDLKKYRRRNAHIPDLVREVERKLTADLGGLWYATYWLHRKTTKPFQNLLRWFRRRRQPPLPSSVAGHQTQGSAGPPPPPRQEVAEALPKVLECLRFTHCVLAVSHSDYRITVAGTQRLLQQEEELLATRGISYLEIHPSAGQPVPKAGNRDFLMGLYVDSQFMGVFDAAQLRQILEGLTRGGVKVEMVHLHHLLGFDLELLDEVLNVLPAPKRFFIHDFYSVCRQFNLLKNDSQFCGGPPVTSPACRDCAYGTRRPAHFGGFQKFFQKWAPGFVAPSRLAREIWIGSFPHLAHQVRVVPHLVARPAVDDPVRQVSGRRIRIAYVGYQHPFKGWEEWKRLAGLLRRQHYQPFVLGKCSELLPEVEYVPVSFIEHGPDAMTRALRENAIDLAFLWSLVPETYSFTVFESMAAGCFVLTCARSGNIAAEVSQSGRGLVAGDLDELLALLQDAQRMVARLEHFQAQNPPFALAPNPALAEELAATFPARSPFRSPTAAELARSVLKSDSSACLRQE